MLDSNYDGSGNRIHLGVQTAGGGDPLSHDWRFDARNRLYQAVFPGGSDPTIALASWDSDDLRTLTHGNSATTQYRYQANGPVDTITVNDSGSTQ